MDKLFRQNFEADWKEMKSDIKFLRENAVRKKDIISSWRFYLGLLIPTILAIIALIRS
jgi:hypothetical protein